MEHLRFPKPPKRVAQKFHFAILRIEVTSASRGLSAIAELLVTHRRSVAKRGGCFQRRLFVSVFVRTITSERLNVRRSNLVVRYTVQKSSPNSKVKVKRQRSRSPRT